MVLTEEQVKEKFMEFQFIQKQLEKIQGHAETLTNQAQELEISVNAIKELGKTAPKTEILAPIANGIFIKAQLNDNQKLIVNVGSDTTVERTTEETAALLEKQREEVAKSIIEAESVQQQLAQHAMKLYQEIEEHMKEDEE